MNYMANVSKYVDEFRLHHDNNWHFQRRLLIFLFILILVMILIGVIFSVYQRSNAPTFTYLGEVTIDGNSYAPNFSEDIYDYYLLTNDERLDIKCKTSGNVSITGCDETIDLTNYSNYIHEIVISEQSKKIIYKFYIKVKESDSEENIVISKVEKSNSWTNDDLRLKINVDSKNAIKDYSFDNGKTWQSENFIDVKENGRLNVIVRDSYNHESAVRQVEVKNIDKTQPKGIIVKDSSSSDRIVLKVVAKDEESGIVGYSWDDQPYSKDTKLTISQKGTHHVKIKDRAGNVEEISIQIKDSDFNNRKQYVATFYENGAEEIENDFLSCSVQSGSCNITLPDIKRKNAKILGWATDAKSKNVVYRAGERVALDGDITLYAVSVRKLEASFESKIANVSRSSAECVLYNADSFCYVQAPDISYDRGKIIGWNTNSNVKTVLESPKSFIKLYDDATYHALVFRELMVKFDGNGADDISSRKEMCQLTDDSENCLVTFPMITRRDAEIIGWSRNKNAEEAQYKVGEEYSVENNATYYAITKKSVEYRFDRNGADAISDNVLSCDIYNRQKKCSIVMPVIERNNADILGWSTDKNAKKGMIEMGSTQQVDRDANYYAITSKTVTITFVENGSDSITSSLEECQFFNDAGCTITTPKINRSGWKILGWATKKNATSATAEVNSSIKVKNDATYYAITSRRVTANINRNNADSLGNCAKVTASGCAVSCDIYNLQNNCSVDLPYIYSRGNEVQFFSVNSDSDAEVGYSPANKLNLYDDITLNAIVDNRYRPRTLSIGKTKKYNYTAFEAEATCPSKVYDNYYLLLDRAYAKAPYLFVAAKVSFVSSDTFDEIWGNYSGMTYGSALGYRNIDVKCPNTYSDYYLQTLIHELAHGWDSYYKAKKNQHISDTNDIKNLYYKYKNASKQPLRSYAYNDIDEFFADLYAWYYFLYIDVDNQPRIIKNNMYYPQDMKKVVEKYIRISNNGYK